MEVMDQEGTKDSSQQISGLKPVYVKFPKDRGLTGISIKESKAVFANDGEYNVSYAPEIDNCINTS